MICCFMNLHEKENVRDLVKHFDTEIEKAILFGCTKFLSGEKYAEEKIFKERVENAAKFYDEGEIDFIGINAKGNKELKRFLMEIADWEIYSY